MTGRPARSLAAEAAFRAALAAIGAEMLEPTWLGSLKPHLVRCSVGHECRPRPACVQQGQGICRACAGRDPSQAEAAFKSRLIAMGATLLEPEWLGVMRPHAVRCALGHASAPRPINVKNGQGICRVCARNDSSQAEAEFRARLAGFGAELLEPYRGTGYPHLVRCRGGHQCVVRPGNLQQGWGLCRTCAGQDPAVTSQLFRQRVEALGGAVLGHYVNSTTPVAVRCRAGHGCTPRPGDLTQGHGLCRKCSGMVWDAFYVVTSQAALKFGITSGDARPRLGVHRAAGYRSVVRLLTGLPGDLAPEMERSVKAALAMAAIKPVAGREYFHLDALPVVLDIADNYPIQLQEAS